MEKHSGGAFCYNSHKNPVNLKQTIKNNTHTKELVLLEASEAVQLIYALEGL